MKSHSIRFLYAFPTCPFFFHQVWNRSCLRPCIQTGSGLISASITQTCLVIKLHFCCLSVPLCNMYRRMQRTSGDNSGQSLLTAKLSAHLPQQTIDRVTLLRGLFFAFTPYVVCKDLVCTDDSPLASFSQATKRPRDPVDAFNWARSVELFLCCYMLNRL